ncbi:MAG: glycyl-radical enzyme activating protein [Candidatus Latescibacterota bacterium]|nr:MAG: glycyl-radical enzyme activating protein [Candidatus Latescibacterota bacterium]
MTKTGVIFDIKRFAVHDGPGIRTTVFLKGCPLSCWWCHNPESQSAKPDILYRRHLCVRCGTCVETCPENARSLTENGVERDATCCTICGTCVDVCPSGATEKVGRELTARDLMEEIERDTPFYDQSGGGVTFSGGEPLTQPDFLRELLERCGDRDIHRAVDTCGFADPSTLRSIAEKTDLFLFDLKLMDPERHLEYTGVRNELILSNLTMLAGSGKTVHVRIPVIPTITDADENFDAIGRFVSRLPKPPHVRLLRHHPTAMEKYARFKMERRLPDGMDTPSRKELGRIASRLTEYGLEVSY